MIKAVVLAPVAAVVLLLGVAASASAGTLDQQQTVAGGLGYGIDSTHSVAQTFTAGISGGIDQVDLFLYEVAGTPSAPLNVQIRDAFGGVPGGTVLAGQTIPATALTSSPAFTPIHFTPAAPVTAGTLYTIVAFSAAAAPPDYGWGASSTDNPYPGGGGFTAGGSPSGPWTPITLPAADLAFKTYVVPTPPSPPSTATGQRAASLKRCKQRAKKHNWTRNRLKKCKRKANLLPV
jgi:hypothetical protein